MKISDFRCPPHLFLIAVVVFSFIPSTLLAAHHILLVGVGSNSTTLKPLVGPRHDVLALKNLFMNRYDIPETQIHTLVDQQATKRNILKALERLDSQAEAGDKILFYFSGHGTSFHDTDADYRVSSLLKNTGALFPYDMGFVDDYGRHVDEFNNPATADYFYNRLIVGRRDLVPRLKKLEGKNRTVLAIFDTCYSGNAVRSFRSERYGGGEFVSSRHFPLRGGLASGLADLAGESFGAPQNLVEKPFPYSRVFAISAASESEPALDIREEDMKRCGTTVDGRPHGVMTNSLLLALSSRNTDANNDGTLSIHEIFTKVKDATTRISARLGRRHTPHKLPENSQLQFKSFFASSITDSSGLDQVQIPSPRTSLSIEVDDNLERVQKKLAAMPFISLTEKDADYTVLQMRDTVVLLDDVDRPVIRFDSEHDAGTKLPVILKRRYHLKSVIDKVYPDSSFNVALDLADKEGENVVMGERVKFSVSLESDAYLLFLNLAPDGTINVLYPYEDYELDKLRAGESIQFDWDITVSPPAGMEVLKIFAFRTRPAGIENLLGADTFSPGSGYWDTLLDIIGEERVLSDSSQSGANTIKTPYKDRDKSQHTLFLTSFYKNEVKRK